MDIKEISKMGNKELLTNFSHLSRIEGRSDVLNNHFPDDGLYVDIKIMENEIMKRMSRGGVIDNTSFTAN